MSFDGLLIQTFRTNRRTQTGTDDYGQPIYRYDPHLTGKCRNQPRRGAADEVMDVYGNMVVSTHRCYTHIVDVVEGDKIWVSTAGGGPDFTATEREFDILSVSNAAGHEHHFQLELKAIEPEQE